MHKSQHTYDVLVSGGGPVGLLIAYGLQRMGISTCVVERLEKSKIPIYGRGCALYPRTLELLDQYDLLAKFAQIGFVGRSGPNYDKDGNPDNSRGQTRQLMDSVQGQTFFDFLLFIRLKYSEEIIQREYVRSGGVVLAGWETVKLIDGTQKGVEEAKDRYPVKIEIASVVSRETGLLAGKYLIGTDGTRSTVRSLAHISAAEDSTTLRWVRIDGLAETDVPDACDGLAFFESPTHGNVLLANIDHGCTRIGFALTAAMVEKYGDHPTQEQCVAEAKQSLKPFSIDFKTVDWFTTYGVRHLVADAFIKDRVILAGDACHSHSSGTAQGMNTGVHDAFNLAWKLAGVLKKWYRPSVLATYETERRPIAQRLIQVDKASSALISGTIPADLAHLSDDPNVVFTSLIAENLTFTTGLGIKYDSNILNVPTKAGTLACGCRAPDVLVYAPGAGSRLPTRIQSIMKNTGAFWVVVFAGEPALTRERLKLFRSYVDSPAAKDLLPVSREPGQEDCARAKFLTLIAGNRPQADEALGMERFGDAFWDHDSSAHARYGVSVQRGAVVVIRPDGIIGFAAPLDRGEDVGTYFREIFL